MVGMEKPDFESIKTLIGTIDGFDLDATFYVSETDGSVVESEMAYSFSSKY